jgi:hypothetical protein
VRWQLVPESLEQLREALLARGEAPPVSLSHGSLPPPGGSPQEAALLRRVAPYLELLYLMMLSDGRSGEAERRLLWGAARTLSGDRLTRASFDATVEGFDNLRVAEGIEARLDAISGWLVTDRLGAEAAFTLAGAMAVADREVAPNERDLLAELGERLGISSARAAELLGNVGAQPSP